MSSQQPPEWNASYGSPYPTAYGPPAPNAPHPHGPGIDGGLPQQMGMPGTVRAAQITFFIAAGLALLGIVIAATTGDVEKSGMITGVNLHVFIGFVSALRFGKGKGKGSATVIAVLMIAVGFGSLRQLPAVLVQFVAGVVILVLLAQKQSKYWFRRPAR